MLCSIVSHYILTLDHVSRGVTTFRAFLKGTERVLNFLGSVTANCIFPANVLHSVLTIMIYHYQHIFVGTQDNAVLKARARVHIVY